MNADPATIQIADAVEQLLLDAGVAGGRVFHIYPDDAALKIDAVALGIELAEPTGRYMKGAPVDWSATLRTDIYSRFGPSNPRPHDAVTKLYAEVYAVLMANSTLGGLAMDVAPGPVSFNYADDARQLALASSNFVVLYRTGELNLTPQ